MKTLILTLASALATVAFAQEQAAEIVKPARNATMRQMGPRSGDRMGMGMPMVDPILRMAATPQFAAKLGLTSDQAAKLKEATKGNNAQNRETQVKIRKCMERQNDLLKADTIDEAAIMATVDELFELRKSAMKAQLTRMIAARAILTPEQFAKAKAMLEEFRGGRRPPKTAKGKPDAAPKADVAPKAE